MEVVDLRTLRPLDRETILASVRKTSKALIVSEDNLTGGVGGEVAALIAQEAFRGPGRPGDAPRRAGRPGDALRRTSGGGLHALHRADRGRHAPPRAY